MLVDEWVDRPQNTQKLAPDHGQRGEVTDDHRQLPGGEKARLEHIVQGLPKLPSASPLRNEFSTSEGQPKQVEIDGGLLPLMSVETESMRRGLDARGHVADVVAGDPKHCQVVDVHREHR